MGDRMFCSVIYCESSDNLTLEKHYNLPSEWLYWKTHVRAMFKIWQRTWFWWHTWMISHTLSQAEADMSQAFRACCATSWTRQVKQPLLSSDNFILSRDITFMSCWFHGSSFKGFSIVFPAPWLAKVESSQKSNGMWFPDIFRVIFVLPLQKQ